MLYIKPWGLLIPLFHKVHVCTLLEPGVFVEMSENCNEYIFWIGTTAQQSADELKQFIFREISQFTELDLSGVPHHPS